jgi:exopolyphosphatase/pppGpp-phosphohydrolase
MTPQLGLRRIRIGSRPARTSRNQAHAFPNRYIRWRFRRMTGLINNHADAVAFNTSPPLRDVRLRGRLGCSDHERRVATIATRLFDLMAPKHQLAATYRELLHLAALLHDAAKPTGSDGHEVRGAEMVMSDPTLRVTPWQRRAVAFLIRYHRGEIPAADEILQRGDGRRKLYMLLGFLRAADALDRRRVSATALIIRRTGHKLRVQCLVEGDAGEARKLLGRARKFTLLEQTFGVRVRVRVDSMLAADH